MDINIYIYADQEIFGYRTPKYWEQIIKKYVYTADSISLREVSDH